MGYHGEFGEDLVSERSISGGQIIPDVVRSDVFVVLEVWGGRTARRESAVRTQWKETSQRQDVSGVSGWGAGISLAKSRRIT